MGTASQLDGRIWVFDSPLIFKLGLYVLRVLYGDSVHVKFKLCNRVLGSCSRVERNTASSESPSPERVRPPPQKQLLLVYPQTRAVLLWFPALLPAVPSSTCREVEAGSQQRVSFPDCCRGTVMAHVAPVGGLPRDFLSPAVTEDCSSRPCTHSARVSGAKSPSAVLAGPQGVPWCFYPYC